MEHADLQPIDEAALADFALRLIGATSLSGDEGAAAEVTAAEMRRLGLAVERDEAGNVLGSIGDESGPTVLIDAHLDTVGVTEPEAWSQPPAGERVGGRIYGRGAMDMKGPLAAAVHGAASLAGRLPRGRVVVAATLAEELVEGPATELVARRLRPDFVIIGEATSLKLARGQRGRAEIVVTTHGQPTHSSRPELGVNAAQAMVDIIVALREIAPPEHPVL
ncbi:MAG TPA: M20/M25/M40 family metallo-hydrolase, partial [Thermomicrobiaceae bacterium]|nr:M20/M25/M40 family metallo-hydrolase [Thermomicrobiaceae bacterium]